VIEVRHRVLLVPVGRHARHRRSPTVSWAPRLPPGSRLRVDGPRGQVILQTSAAAERIPAGAKAGLSAVDLATPRRGRETLGGAGVQSSPGREILEPSRGPSRRRERGARSSRSA
jgi:hypothetical protein